MGRAWRHNEAAGGQVELETRSCFSGYNQTIFKDRTDFYDASNSSYLSAPGTTQISFLCRQALSQVSNLLDKELPRDMFRFKTV